MVAQINSLLLENFRLTNEVIPVELMVKLASE